MTTQVKRGRPPKKAVEQAPAKKKFTVKQNINTNATLEFKLLNGSQAVFMMQQKNITVYDKDQDTVRQIRYCPNEQGANAVRQSIIFNDGRIFVTPDKPNLREYLQTHPDNRANGGKLFYQVDKQKKATVDVNKEFATADAVLMVKEKPYEDLLSVAASLGFNVDRQAAEIKHDLLMYAKKNPSEFIRMFDNPEVTMKAKIRMAMKYGIIEVSQGGARWVDTNKLIVSVPAGRNGVDVLLRFLLTEAGAPTVEELDRQL